MRIITSLSIAVGSVLPVLLVLLVSSQSVRKTFRSELASGNAASSASYVSATKGDLAWYRAERELMRTRDPRSGMIPPGIRIRTQHYTATLPVVSHDALGKQSATSASEAWVQRGPANVGGRCLDLAVDLDDPHSLIAASASGGIWKSTDLGSSWYKTSPAHENQTVYCLAQNPHPNRHHEWYSGSGELLSTTDRRISISARTVGMGDGIFKSTDRGETWIALAATQSGDAADLTDPFQGVWDLVFNPVSQDPDEIYAACYGAIMRTRDSGESWQRLLGEEEHVSFGSALAIREDGLMLGVLGGYSIHGVRPKTAGVYVSTDGDDWELITPEGFPRDVRVIKLAVCPLSQDIYVYTESPRTGGFTASQHELWKYSRHASGQGTWTDLTANLPGGGSGSVNSDGLNSLGGYAMAITVHPGDENVIFLGGTSLYRSTDAFTSKSGVKKVGGYPFNWRSNQLHPDLHAVLFHPVIPGLLFTASDGGIHATEEYQADDIQWQTRSSNLITSQFYFTAVDHATPDDPYIVGGLQDNGTYYASNDAPRSQWRIAAGGDGMTCAVANGKEYTLISIYSGRIYSFKQVDSVTTEKEYQQSPTFLGSGEFNFYTVFQLDPVNAQTLYLASRNSIWRKDDMAAAAENRTLRDSGWMEMTKCIIPPNNQITAFGMSRSSSDRLYYGSSLGLVHRVDDPATGNPQPTDITGAAFPTGGFVSCIAVHPHDADRLFVIFSNYNVRSIFYSSDAGNSWSDQSGNLEQFPDGSGAGPSVRWLDMLSIGSREVYFAATGHGLYSTTELNGTSTLWKREGEENMGALLVDMVVARQIDATVVAATQGNGVFTKTFDHLLDTPQIPMPLVFEAGSNYPNPFSSSTHIPVRLHSKSDLLLTVYDRSGQRVAQRRYADLASGRHVLSFKSAHLPDGLYFYRLTVAGQSSSGKFLILNARR